MNQEPLTEAEMRQMWANGVTLALIANRARLRNGLSKAAVRAIIFGKEAK